MNNKIKKIFAGIGLGLAGICLLTGCSANIDVSQDDIDKTITNANEFFASVDDTNQNLQNIDNAVNNTNESLADINDNLQNINNNLELQTKDSEYARQYLLSLLSNGIYDSIGNQEFSMTITGKHYVYNVLDTNSSASFNAYWDGNTYKALLENSTNGNSIYQEVVRNVDNDTHAVTYTENLYSNDGKGSKTYTTKENQKTFDNLSSQITFVVDYYSLYTYMFEMIYNSTYDSFYTVEAIDGGLRFAMNTVDEIGDSESVRNVDYSSVVFEFVNGKLTKLTQVIGPVPAYGLANEEPISNSITTYEFNDTVTPIEFDKTGYVLQPNE